MQITPQIKILTASNELQVQVDGRERNIALENQLMHLLQLLAAHAGEVVPKTVFIDSIWQGHALSGEPALSKNIFRLRSLLKAEGLEALFHVETVPKKGYRLVVAGPQKQVPRKIIAPLAFAISIILAVVLALSFLSPETQRPQPQTLVSGGDTVILLGKVPVRVIDTDTVSGVVVLESPED